MFIEMTITMYQFKLIKLHMIGFENQILCLQPS
jgi:hypothetical protein